MAAKKELIIEGMITATVALTGAGQRPGHEVGTVG